MMSQGEDIGRISLADLYCLRCFATIGLDLGTIRDTSEDWAEDLAACIASPTNCALMTMATSGVPRYRLDFPE